MTTTFCDLPSLVLLKILESLERSHILTLMKTNRFMYQAILESRRHKITLKTITIEQCFRNNVETFVFRMFQKKGNETIRYQNAIMKLNVEEQYPCNASDNTPTPYEKARDNFLYRMQCLFKHVDVHALRLSGIDEAVLRGLSKIFDINWTTVKELNIFKEAIASPVLGELLSFIRGLKKLIVTIKSDTLCREFFKLPQILNSLEHLEVNASNDDGTPIRIWPQRYNIHLGGDPEQPFYLDEADILAISATTLALEFPVRLSAEGFRRILLKYVPSKGAIWGSIRYQFITNTTRFDAFEVFGELPFKKGRQLLSEETLSYVIMKGDRESFAVEVTPDRYIVRELDPAGWLGASR